ncbi:extracellular solute-binding protein [Paenibacillus sp. GYB004]|uniref:extracellular solute-binding protein n=1 Tax=Paenibacillus sp. GYB004 TaxID=2994393 RepID=UPI002F96C9C0
MMHNSKQKQSRTTFKERLDHMVKTLRHDIAAGKYQIGEYLPSEANLVDMFSLSINSVRKGLNQLVAEGIIVKKKKVGNMVVKAPGSECVTITFGYHLSMDGIADINCLISEFEAKHPHIKVVPVQLSILNYNEIVKNYMNNDMLDVVTIRETELQTYEERGELDLLEPSEVNSGAYSFLLDTFSREGVLYACPFVFSPVILCYNREHFLGKDLPEPDSSWSWDDLIRITSQLSEPPGRYGFYFNYLSEHRWPIFLLQSGKPDTTRWMDAVRLCKSIIANRQLFPLYAEEHDIDAMSLFLEEKVSVIMTTYFNLNLLKNARFSFDIAPVPHQNEQKTMMLAVGLAVNRWSKKKAAARELVHFLTSAEAQHHIRKRTLSIPGLKKAAEWTGEEEMYRPSRYTMYREIIPTFRTLADLPLSADELRQLQREFKLYWSDIADEAALSEFVEQML